jgi:hypothetical protein
MDSFSKALRRGTGVGELGAESKDVMDRCTSPIQFLRSKAR